MFLKRLRQTAQRAICYRFVSTVARTEGVIETHSKSFKLAILAFFGFVCFECSLGFVGAHLETLRLESRFAAEGCFLGQSRVAVAEGVAELANLGF